MNPKPEIQKKLEQLLILHSNYVIADTEGFRSPRVVDAAFEKFVIAKEHFLSDLAKLSAKETWG